VLLLTNSWRLAYGLFAGLAFVGLLATWFYIPSVSRVTPANAAPPEPIDASTWWKLLRLSLFAFVMGFVAAAYWVFAPDLVINLGKLDSAMSSFLWLAVGLAGLGGAVVSDLADRNNPPVTHSLMLVMMSASLALLAASPAQLPLAVFSALVFGLSYMSLTGLYLLTGIRLLPGRLSMGPVLPFLACALGQAVGSPIIGYLVRELGYADAFASFAALGIAAAMASPLFPRYLEVQDDEPPEDTGLQAAYDHQLLDKDGNPLSSFTQPDSEPVPFNEPEQIGQAADGRRT
jgi:predicted MFS family arabinose efflux permease